MPGQPLPNFAHAKDIADIVRQLSSLVRTLEIRLAAIERVPNPESGYETSNVVASRTFDADTVTLPELADVVGTLVADLQKAGGIR